MSITFIYPQYLWLLLIIPIISSFSLIGWFSGAQRSLGVQRFWTVQVIRAIIIILVVVALAGIQLRMRSDILTTIFVLDVSDSVSPEEVSQGEDFIRSAIEKMPVGDRASVVVFGRDALVERLATEDRMLPTITSIPITTRTDIFGALQLAQAIFPSEGAKRIILLSDGRENLRSALDQAEVIAMSGIELLYYPLGGEPENVEVLVDEVIAPSDTRQGADIEIIAVINSTAKVSASLRLFVDGRLLETQDTVLAPGTTRIPFVISADNVAFKNGEIGNFHRFRVQIVPDQDGRLQNNEAYAFSLVQSPPNILIVEGQSGDGENLEAVLKTANMLVRRIQPAQIPGKLDELAGFSAIILVNVKATSLPIGVMDALPVYVRELGFGLLMVGGQDAYGAGGYLRTPLEKALPVTMDIRDKELQANIALVLAVDKSGSMGKCHCDNPDLNQTYTRQEVGQPKVDIAKEAIMRAASALGEQDYLGVVTFDESAHWSLQVVRLVDPYTLEQSIGSIKAQGTTNLESGVRAAYQALQGVTARRKHIILMTDGWVRQGDLTPLVIEMEENGITLSVVAAGEGSAQYLASLAALGGGRYYPATDVFSVPDIFLKETMTSVGQYVIEEPFYPLPSAPSPILKGVDLSQLPILLGYNGATAKNTARQDLITPRGDPLLATWQYGLGRSAAWTSDLKGQWATNWISWQSFPRFAAQLVDWLLPAARVEGIESTVKLEEGKVVVRLVALGKDGYPLNSVKAQAIMVDPDLGTSTYDLEQVGSGEYQADIEVTKPGTYLVRIGANQNDQSLGQITHGIVIPYSPEYKSIGIERSILNKIALVTGGKEILDPLDSFLHTLKPVNSSREIWHPLLIVVAFLFVFDVALRRLSISISDLQIVQRNILTRLSKTMRQPDLDRPRVFPRLFGARERAREMQRKVITGEGVARRESEELCQGEEPEGKKTPTVPTTLDGGSQDNAMERLKKAKSRAKRG